MLQLLKSIFSDVFILYKNFFHFTVSKIIIILFSILLGLTLASPFIIIFLVITFLTDLSEVFLLLNNASFDQLLTSFNNHTFLWIIDILSLVFTVIAFLFGFIYNWILLFNLNLNYIDGKKLPFMKNKYFKFRIIFGYFKILSLNFLAILCLLSTHSLIVFIFGGNSGFVEFLGPIFHGIYSLIFLFIFLYISFRFLFSYIILLDSDKKKKALELIGKSFKKTKKKKKFYKFIAVMIVFFIMLSPYYIFKTYLESQNYTDKQYYGYYYMATPTQRVQANNQNTVQFYQNLKVEYIGVSPEKIVENIKFRENLLKLLQILDFLFIYGLFEMIIVSFYRREIKENL